MKEKIFFIFYLILIFILALFLRVYFSYSEVFSEPIKYAADDGIYHMRLVENMLFSNHFPRRLFFDVFTYFPYGTYIHFGPLYDQLLAGIIWVISLGHPTFYLLNKIAPFYPAIMGSLMVFLIYFLARAIWDRKIALLSTFLMAISSPYLYRSLLGMTDHHVAEVLFSTLAMTFLILALKARNKIEAEGKLLENRPFFDKIKMELKNNRKFWLFTFLTGFSLGLYFLTWNGALLFLFIIFVFIVLYYLTQYLFSESPNWILFMGITIFLITLVMIAPFLNHPDPFYARLYNIKHLASIIISVFIFLFLAGAGSFIKRKKMDPRFLFAFLIFIIILFLLILKFVSPFILNELVESFRAINTSLSPSKFAKELTFEMRPLSLQGAFDFFSSLFYLSLIAITIIFYKFIKERKPEYLLIFIWSITIILVSGIIPFFGQLRFNYYLSVNISLLSSFLVINGFKFGWRGLKVAQEHNKQSPIRSYLLVGSVLIIFNSIFFLIFPFPFNIGYSFPQNLPDILRVAIETSKGGPFIFGNDWYEAMLWLKKNTPDPGVDYYSLYEEPNVNKQTGKINSYSYPSEAYGILARWDVGHMITYYAHRMPNSNPFQQGVGSKNGDEVSELGGGVFFLEIDEDKAIGYLDKLRTKYIITDFDSANPALGFPAIIKWVQGNTEGYLKDKSSTEPSKYDNSILARLHILDGTGTITEREINGQKIKFSIGPLDHFRLVYESNTTVNSSPENPTDIVKAIKIFEYVKSAKIVGKAESGTQISLSTEITTNQGRKFFYKKSAEAKDSYFEFIVPYSTFGKEGRLSGQTQFEVFASPYKLKIGDKLFDISISENDILEGKVIEEK